MNKKTYFLNSPSKSLNERIWLVWALPISEAPAISVFSEPEAAPISVFGKPVRVDGDRGTAVRTLMLAFDGAETSKQLSRRFETRMIRMKKLILDDEKNADSLCKLKFA